MPFRDATAARMKIDILLHFGEPRGMCVRAHACVMYAVFVCVVLPCHSHVCARKCVCVCVRGILSRAQAVIGWRLLAARGEGGGLRVAFCDIKASALLMLSRDQLRGQAQCRPVGSLSRCDWLPVFSHCCLILFPGFLLKVAS